MCVGKEVAASGLAFGGGKKIYAKREGAVANISLGSTKEEENPKVTEAKAHKSGDLLRNLSVYSPDFCFVFFFCVGIFLLLTGFEPSHSLT